MKSSRLVAGIGLALAAFSPQVFAGTAIDSSKGKEMVTPAPEPKLNEVSFTSSYTFDADFKGDDHGSIDAAFYKFEASHRIALPQENWYVRLGLQYDRIDFGLGRAPVPSHLQGAAAVIAVEYFRNGQNGFLFETHPGIYCANDVSADAFDAPTDIGFAYPLSDNFAVVVGASFSLLRQYPVIPAVGINWKINDQWLLKLYAPEPRLVYSPAENLKVWVGGSFAGGAYRADTREIKPGSLSNAVITYTEIRAGGGLTYNFTPDISLEVSGGYAMDRSFDYYRADKEYDLDNAPYASCRLSASF